MRLRQKNPVCAALKPKVVLETFSVVLELGSRHERAKRHGDFSFSDDVVNLGVSCEPSISLAQPAGLPSHFVHRAPILVLEAPGCGGQHPVTPFPRGLSSVQLPIISMAGVGQDYE